MLATLVLGLSLSAGAAQFTLGQLLGALASSRHGTATFTEKKYLSILDQPVESSGELLFVPPARLEKRTLKPKVETLVLDGDVLTVERQMQRHVLQLKDYPEVAGMTESIRATLAGDRQALERVYRLGRVLERQDHGEGVTVKALLPEAELRHVRGLLERRS